MPITTEYGLMISERYVYDDVDFLLQKSLTGLRPHKCILQCSVYYDYAISIDYFGEHC